MEFITRQLPKKCTIIDTSDWHIGPANCDIKGIKKLIQRIQDDDKCFMIFKGDACDAIVGSDKRWAASAVDYENPLLTPHEQCDRVIELIAPIRDKILVWMMGNHEMKIANHFNMGRYICESLDIPYGGYDCKFIALDKNNNPTFKFYLTHGMGSMTSNAKDPIQREANIKASLKLKLDRSGHKDCVYMSMGHTHQLLVVEPTINKEVMLYDVDGKLVQDYRNDVDQTSRYIPSEGRWYGNSGSFLKLYSDPGSFQTSYAEMAGYAPAELGWLEIDVRKRQVTNVRRVIA